MTHELEDGDDAERVRMSTDRPTDHRPTDRPTNRPTDRPTEEA